MSWSFGYSIVLENFSGNLAAGIKTFFNPVDFDKIVTVRITQDWHRPRYICFIKLADLNTELLLETACDLDFSQRIDFDFQFV